MTFDPSISLYFSYFELVEIEFSFLSIFNYSCEFWFLSGHNNLLFEQHKYVGNMFATSHQENPKINQKIKVDLKEWA